MTIKEVCEQYEISQDTLRYYERVGAIPEVTRTPGGNRDYTEEDYNTCIAEAKKDLQSKARPELVDR